MFNKSKINGINFDLDNVSTFSKMYVINKFAVKVLFEKHKSSYIIRSHNSFLNKTKYNTYYSVSFFQWFECTTNIP